MLFSGDALAWQVAGALLTCLAGKVRSVGQRVGDAATLDLAWLTMSYVKFMGVAHAAGICRAQGIDLQAFIELFPADPYACKLARIIKDEAYDHPTATLEVWGEALARIECRRGMRASRLPYRISSPVTSSRQWPWDWGNRKRWRSTRLSW